MELAQDEEMREVEELDIDEHMVKMGKKFGLWNDDPVDVNTVQ
jgi:hypothetical protein